MMSVQSVLKWRYTWVEAVVADEVHIAGVAALSWRLAKLEFRVGGDCLRRTAAI